TGSVEDMLEVLNDVTAPGPSDWLDGSFDLTGANGDFGLSGFGDVISNLLAGESQAGFDVGFDASALGTFTEDLTLDATSNNNGGYSGDAQDQDLTLVLTADVVAPGQTVPEPSTLFLSAGGLAALAWMRRYRPFLGVRPRRNRR
ncbi:MAG: PEP-CTERM sorting domain-containing protein, partial [Thiobacillaceae bacterium]